MSEAWVVYAARTTYCGEVVEILNRAGHRIAAVVDNLDDGPRPAGGGATIAPRDLDEALQARPGVIPLTTPGFREIAVADARKHGLNRFPALVDPTAVVAGSAVIASGVVVNAGVVIGAGASLDEFVSVNRSASIGHDDRLERFVSVGPGAVLGGGVVVERGAFIGIGATALPNVRIGANAVIGGGAVVTRDVPERAVVVGNPARVVRIGTSGYQGGTVTHG